MAGRGFFILCQPFLHPVKKVVGNDGRDTIRHNDVPVAVLPDVAAVVQKMLDAVVGQWLPSRIFHALPIQIIPNFFHGCPLGILLERFKNKRRSQWVKLKILLAVNEITNGQCASVVLGFERVLRHAPDHLLREISGVIFGVTF